MSCCSGRLGSISSPARWAFRVHVGSQAWPPISHHYQWICLFFCINMTICLMCFFGINIAYSERFKWWLIYNCNVLLLLMYAAALETLETHATPGRVPALLSQNASTHIDININYQISTININYQYQLSTINYQYQLSTININQISTVLLTN